jgi:uncharacterized protein DUF3253
VLYRIGFQCNIATYFGRARRSLAPPDLPRSLPAPMTQPADTAEAAIREEILRQTSARGADRSICPSEVARALAGGDDGPWRPLMGPVRRVAVELARAGRIEILRKGKPVPPEAARGVVRLRAPSAATGE